MYQHLRKQLVVTLGIVGFSLCPSVYANYLGSDSFEYTPDSGLRDYALGANGGFAWGGSWSTATASTFATNRTPGLSYGALSTGGGMLEVGDPALLSTGTTSAQRVLPGTLGGLGYGSYWISFLYQNLNTAADITGAQTGFRQANLGLFSGTSVNGSGISQANGSERFAIGAPNNYTGQPAAGTDVMTLWNGSTYSYSPLATPRGVSQDAVWVVMNLLVDNTTGNDTVYAWFNPSLASQPDIGTATVFNGSDLSSVNSIRFQVGGGNSGGPAAHMNVDELRVGTSWGEMLVVPEPASVTILGLGSLALLGRIRRR